MPLKFGFSIFQPCPEFDELFKVVRRYENAGFHSCWVADHTMIPPPERSFVPDTLTMLGALMLNTKTLKFAPSVTDPHRRSVIVLAQTLATLDHLSRGRLLFGIGSGESMNLDPFAIPWDKPVARTLEAVELIKRLWSEEDCFDFDGEFYKVNKGFLQLAPFQSPHPPIYYAANGPRNLRLTGELFDGWHPVQETPKTYGIHIKEVEKGARAAGRTLDDIDCTMIIAASVAEDTDKAYEAVSDMGFFAVTLPKKLRAAGYDIPELAGLSDNYYLDEVMVDGKSFEEYVKMGRYITEDIIRDFMLVGTVDECIERIAEFADAGMNHLVIMNHSTDHDRGIDYFKEQIIPYFSE